VPPSQDDEEETPPPPYVYEGPREGGEKKTITSSAGKSQEITLLGARSTDKGETGKASFPNGDKYVRRCPRPLSKCAAAVQH